MENNENPYASPHSNVNFEAIGSKLPFFKSWLIFFLITTFGGFVVGAVFGAIIGGILGGAGVSINIIKMTSGAVGLVLSFPISFFTFKWSVSKYLIASSHVDNA